MTAPFDLVSFANGLLASQRPGKPVTVDTVTDDQIRELRDSGAISSSVYEFATASCWDNRDYRARCAEILNARSAPNCSGCQFNPATRRDADDVADVCDECGEASDDQKRDRERRMRRMAEREEI